MRLFGVRRPGDSFRDLRTGPIEAESPVSEQEDREARAQPDGTVGEHDSRHRRQHRVALGGGPIARRAAEGAKAERIAERGDRVEAGIAQEYPAGGEEREEADQTHVSPHHRARHRSEREEARAHHQHRRQPDHEERIKVMIEHERPHLLRVEPRHPRADEHAEGHGSEYEKRHRESAGEAAHQVVKLADAGGAQDRREGGLVVAHDHVGHERGHDEHREDAHDRHGLRDREGRVDVHVAAAAELDLLDGHRAVGEQEKEREADEKQGGAQLVASLEGRDA
jgi:hypothetical protein